MGFSFDTDASTQRVTMVCGCRCPSSRPCSLGNQCQQEKPERLVLVEYAAVIGCPRKTSCKCSARRMPTRVRRSVPGSGARSACRTIKNVVSESENKGDEKIAKPATAITTVQQDLYGQNIRITSNGFLIRQNRLTDRFYCRSKVDY